MSGCEGLRKRLTDVLDTELGDDAVVLREALWDALDAAETYPAVVSGPDVRDLVYIHWPGDPHPVQYQPVPMCYCGDLGWTVEKYARPTHKHGCPARTDSWCQTHPSRCPGTPTGVERRQA